MQHALFEDAGRIHAARVLAQADASLTAELDSGRRVKVKAANVLLRFDGVAPAALLAAAEARARDVDPELAWQFAPDGDFGFADLAGEYFGADAGTGAVERAATLLALHGAPHYFRRAGRGVFRKQPDETVRAALAALARRAEQAARIDGWADELVAGRCPEPVREQLYRLLLRPDKNAPEYKAVVIAARRAQQAPLELLRAAGAIASPYQFHWQRFAFEHFPKGHAFPPLPPAPAAERLAAELPLAEGVAAFSIDDSQTTEIDDALSVRGLGSGTVTLGVHIAAPALAIAPGSAHDALARERMTTTYMPGGKITMLPDDVVAEWTLAAGGERAALSLYVEVDERTLVVRGHATRVERVAIAENLRHDRLDGVVTEASLDAAARGEPQPFAFAAELAFLHRLAKRLKADRERVRGRPETFDRPDATYRLHGQTGTLPDGSETVEIGERRRGAPLDLIVAEAMILANSHWGGWLASLGVPAIYRTQASMAPGVKVRMGTKPAPHAGMGVASYAWSTSPLRRYVDLANQWQLVAAARHGAAAALAAPFKPRDASLLAVVSAFESRNAGVSDFQRAAERYWALRWIEQNAPKGGRAPEVDATVLRDGLVRADMPPLVFRALGAESLERGARVRVAVRAVDLMTLEAHAAVVGRLADAPPGLAAAPAADDDEDDAALAAPVGVAIDVADADADADADAGAAAPDTLAVPAASG